MVFNEQDEFKTQFIRFWKAIVNYYLAHPRETRFLEQFENSPYFEKRVHEQFASQMQPMIHYFQTGVEKGVIKENLPFELLSNMVVVSGVVLVKYQLQGKVSLDEEMIEAAANAAWDMLKKIVFTCNRLNVHSVAI